MTLLLVAVAVWLAFGVLGTLALYIGFGFGMAAKRARDANLTQRKVLILDSAIAFLVVLLDAALNVLFYSVVMFDCRAEYTWTLLTERASRYNSDPNELQFRRTFAAFIGALTDGKDPAGQHVKGQKLLLPWLD